MDYRTKGVCSQSIDVEVENGITLISKITRFIMFPSLADVTVTCREFPT